MSQRGISKEIVNNVLRNGVWQETNGRFCFKVEYKGIVIIVYKHSSKAEIITCRLNRALTLKAEEKRESIGFYKATKKIIKEIEF